MEEDVEEEEYVRDGEDRKVGMGIKGEKGRVPQWAG